MHNVIETRELTKRYGDVLAVDRLSLRVGQGELYGFLGLNGAGKTTTIRMLLSLIRPTAGEACIFGRPVEPGAGDLWARVGYMVETPHAYPELTVRENLELMRRLRHLADTRAVDRVIERLALGAYAHRRTGTLSLGNVQRLGLAKALLHEPELLLLDEPANGLDPAGVVEIRHLLIGLAARGTTILMSSHILTEVSRLATRVGIIHRGRLLEELDRPQLEHRLRRRLVVESLDAGSARAVLAQAGFAANGVGGQIEIADPLALAHPERIADLIVRAGVPLTRLDIVEEDLEAHFLGLVDGAEEEI